MRLQIAIVALVAMSVRAIAALDLASDCAYGADFFVWEHWQSTDGASTPGSDESYAVKSTIRVPDKWLIRVNGAVTNVTSPSLVQIDESPLEWGYDIDNSHLPEDYRLSYRYPYIIDDARDVRDLGWYCFRPTTNIYAYYYAQGTNFVNWTLPRPLYHLQGGRLSGEWQSALIHSMAGVYERLYYGSQGQSNGWDSAEWGKQSAGSDFYIGNTATTNPAGLFARHDFVLAPSSNATARSFVDWDVKRLVNARNLYNFRDNIVSMLGGVPDQNGKAFASALYRPGWLTGEIGYHSNPAESSAYDRQPTLFWWSSSEFGDDFMPSFDWQRDLACNVWSNCCASFRSFANCPIGVFPSGGENPLRYCAELASFHAYDAHVISPYSFAEPFVYWITNKFPFALRDKVYSGPEHSARVTWLTKTMRLDDRPLAGMDQTLALMDRTIHIPVTDFTSNYSIRNVSRLQTTTVQVHFDLEWDPQGVSYVGLATPSAYERGDVSQSVTSVSCSMDGRIPFIVSKPSQYHSGSGELHLQYDPQAVEWVDASDAWMSAWIVSEYLESVVGTNTTFTISGGMVPAGVYLIEADVHDPIYGDDWGMEKYYQCADTLSGDGEIELSASSYFSYAEPMSCSVRVGAHQPGFESSLLVSGFNAAAIGAIVVQDYRQEYEWSEGWEVVDYASWPLPSDTWYRTYYGGDDVASFCRDTVDVGIRQKMRALFANAVCDVSNYAQLAPLLTLSIDGDTWTATATANVDPIGVEVRVVRWDQDHPLDGKFEYREVSTTNAWQSLPFRFYLPHLENIGITVPDSAWSGYNNRRDWGANGRFYPITRTDWNWNHLHKE